MKNPQINPSTRLRTGLGAKRLAPQFTAGFSIAGFYISKLITALSREARDLPSLFKLRLISTINRKKGSYVKRVRALRIFI